MKFLILIATVLLCISCTPYQINASRAHLFDVEDCENISNKNLGNPVASNKNREKCLIQRMPRYDNYSHLKDSSHPNRLFNSAPIYGSNPVFIAEDTKFSIEINEIKPPALSYRKLLGRAKDDLDRARDYTFKKYGPYSNSVVEGNIRNKELWLLTTIKSQNVADPLEANSKVYVKSTQVKWDSGSHLLVPLDKNEKVVFTHESDTSYRVRFQLMEVDALAVKKELAILRNQSGFLNFLQVGVTTLVELLNTAVGKEYINSKIDPILQNDTAFQRFLLSLGATVEFVGEMIILREDEQFIKFHNDTLFHSKEYYLVDGFRSADQPAFINFPNAFNSPNINLFWNDPSGCIVTDIQKNDGGIYKKNTDKRVLDIIEKKQCPQINTLAKIKLKDFKFEDNAPGFISFSVNEIPVEISQAPSIGTDAINQYSDYSQLKEYLSAVKNDLFEELLTCQKDQNKVDTNGDKVDSKSDVLENCKKLNKISSVSNPENTDANNLNLKAVMLAKDIETYVGIEKVYQGKGDDLICLELLKHANYTKIDEPSIFDEFSTNIDRIKINEKNKKDKKDKTLKLNCKARVQDMDGVDTEEKINEIRIEKNNLSIVLDQRKTAIIQKVYKNISKCTPANEESMRTGFKLNKKPYNCSLFQAIKGRQDEFYDMVKLLERPND